MQKSGFLAFFSAHLSDYSNTSHTVADIYATLKAIFHRCSDEYF